MSLEVGSAEGNAAFFEYCTDLFQEHTIVQLERNFTDLLRALIAEPDTPMSRIRAVADINGLVQREATASLA